MTSLTTFKKIETLLVKNGAKLNAKSDKGMTAEKYAEASNANDTLVYIRSLES